MNPILMLIFILLVQLWIPIINPLLGAHLYTNPEWKFQLLYKAPGKYMTNRIYICEWPGPNQFLLDPRVDFSLKDNLIDSSKGCWSCIFQEPTYFSIGDNHIPGDWVKTGVINSWGQGDSGKCREVGLWYCHHVFNKHLRLLYCLLMITFPDFRKKTCGRTRFAALQIWEPRLQSTSRLKKHDGT